MMCKNNFLVLSEDFCRPPCSVGCNLEQGNAPASSLTPLLCFSDPTRLAGINNILQMCEYS